MGSLPCAEYSANRDATELGDLEKNLLAMKQQGPPKDMSQEDFDQHIKSYEEAMRDPEVSKSVNPYTLHPSKRQPAGVSQEQFDLHIKSYEEAIKDPEVRIPKPGI